MSHQSFADFGVSRDVAAALGRRGITSPFPIQCLVLPDALAQRPRRIAAAQARLLPRPRFRDAIRIRRKHRGAANMKGGSNAHGRGRANAVRALEADLAVRQLERLEAIAGVAQRRQRVTRRGQRQRLP